MGSWLERVATATESLLRLPKVPTLDWCDRLAEAVGHLAPDHANAVFIAEFQTRVTLDRSSIDASAGDAVPLATAIAAMGSAPTGSLANTARAGAPIDARVLASGACLARCGQSASNTAPSGSASTGPASTGPASTGPASTGPALAAWSAEVRTWIERPLHDRAAIARFADRSSSPPSPISTIQHIPIAPDARDGTHGPSAPALACPVTEAVRVAHAVGQGVARCQRPSVGPAPFVGPASAPGLLLGAARVGSSSRLVGAVFAQDSSTPADPMLASALTAFLPVLERCVRATVGAGTLHPGEWLSPKEQAVLERLVLGRSVPEIARDLARSPHTVHDHVKNLHRKLSTRSRGELVARALGFGDVEIKPMESLSPLEEA